MERERFAELKRNLNRLNENGLLKEREVFLFAHCNATIELADELLKQGITPKAILDNNPNKYELNYKAIPVCNPETMRGRDNALVLIVSRFFEQMSSQLRSIGFNGNIEKLVDYNTYSEYSLSPDTLIRKSERVKRGIERLNAIKKDFVDCFIVFCPFPALGDVYLCMSYLKHFLEMNGHDGCVVCVVGNAQRQVVELFGYTDVIMLSQNELDEAVQGVIYTNDNDCFIAHQDRPYVVYLHRALYKKLISLETIYKCGVFGLPQDTKPVEPKKWLDFEFARDISVGRSVIVSPYAKSVASLPEVLWEKIVSYLIDKGYSVFTNVVGDELPLQGTKAISPKISELKSVVEHAGLFIGIRSGICDVIQTANAKKIALFPDYFYCDTKWKAIDMYSLEGFDNIVVKEENTWEEIREKMRILMSVGKIN